MLPRDRAELILALGKAGWSVNAIAEQLGYDFRLLKEVQKINAEQLQRFLKKIHEALWIVKDKTIAVLGLAFKPNTDDMRLAPSLEARVDVLERRIIEDCLQRNNFRRKETAAELGISRVTLYNKMKKFGLM